MAFGDLTHLTIDAYIAQEAAPDAVWIFQHIPKTAGTSLTEELATLRPPYANICADYSPGAPKLPEQFRAIVGRLLEQMPDLGLRSASGHLRREFVEQLLGGIPDARVFTILRNPIDRVVSSYRYQRTPMHPPHKEFTAEFPTLLDFVRAPISQNGMTQFIWGPGRLPPPRDLLAHLDSRYTFVGLFECYEASVDVILQLMGSETGATGHHRRRTPDTDETRVAITPEVRAEIAAHNRHDMVLFRVVRERLAQAGLMAPPLRRHRA